MHQALGLREVLKNVFSTLEDSERAEALTTCRIFFEASATELYKTMDAPSLLKFTRVFMCYDDELVPDKLHRMSRYTKWVRGITLRGGWKTKKGEETAGLEEELYNNLHVIALVKGPTGPLFPGLRKIDIALGQNTHLQCATSLLSDVLESVVVTMDDWDADKGKSGVVPLSLLIHALHDKCALLHTVRLRIRGICPHEVQGAPSLSTLLSRFIEGAQRLLVFEGDVYALDEPALLALSQHRRLQELYIGQWKSFVHESGLDGIEDIKAISPEKLFPNLRRFVHHRISGDALFELLHILPRTLVEIVLTLDAAESDDKNLTRISERIRRRFKGLHHCQIELQQDLCGEDEEEDEQVFSMDAFMPLQLCLHMRNFKLIGDYYWGTEMSLALRDEHIMTLAKAWPDLRALEVTWPESEPGEGLKHNSDVTLSALKELAIHCPKLQHVCLTYVDVASIPLDPVLRAPPTTHLISVQLTGSSKVSKVDDLALFLSMIWPNIQLCGKVAKSEDWGPVIERLTLLRRRLRILPESEDDDDEGSEEEPQASQQKHT